jgi:Zn-dependent peptidase ImmA (M78 family)
MNSNLKPILDQIEQIKNKFNDPEFRAKVTENLQHTRENVETRAKDAAKDVLIQARDSRFVNDYVMPLLESQKTEQALQTLKTRFGATQLVSALETVRQQIIDSKAAVAKPVDAAAPEEKTSEKTAAKAQEKNH